MTGGEEVIAALISEPTLTVESAFPETRIFFFNSIPLVRD
jgi:hypothetical protein